MSSTVYSGKPVFKLNKEWVDSKLPLYFEINFGELRKDVPGEAFITVKNGNTSSSVILEKKNIYRSHIDKGEYVGFSKSIKKSNLLDKQKRPIDLKHINEDFFTKDIAPKYNLAIFVMGVGSIVDDAYSVLINLGDLSGFSLSN